MRQDLLSYIVELIAENKAITDTELLGKAKKRYPELTEQVLNSVLLKLEIAGIITVSWLSKDARRIELRGTEE